MTSARLIDSEAPIALPTTRTCPFDPDPELASLRETRPITRMRFTDGHVGWLVTSHALCRTVLTDARFSMDNGNHFPIGDPVKWAAFRDTLRGSGLLKQWLLALDRPEHTRYRRIVAAPFARGPVEGYRAQIEQIVDERLDAMERAGGPLDLVEHFATPVAMSAHCVMLGIPVSEATWLTSMPLRTPSGAASVEEKAAIIGQFRDRLRPVIELRRREPGDDVMSHIVAQEELSDDEITSIAALLFMAGHDVGVSMLAFGAFALLSHPDQLQALRDDPSLIKTAVDELLRYVTISQTGLMRTALEDVELGGQLIRRGETVMISQAAANRDPAAFDDPDELDLGRRATGHLAFGQGIHMCLGQHVSRLELEVGLTRLIERFPGLRLDVPVDDVRTYGGEYINYGVYELPVAW